MGIVLTTEVLGTKRIAVLTKFYASLEAVAIPRTTAP